MAETRVDHLGNLKAGLMACSKAEMRVDYLAYLTAAMRVGYWACSMAQTMVDCLAYLTAAMKAGRLVKWTAGMRADYLVCWMVEKKAGCLARWKAGNDKINLGKVSFFNSQTSRVIDFSPCYLAGR